MGFDFLTLSKELFGAVPILSELLSVEVLDYWMVSKMKIPLKKVRIRWLWRSENWP